LLTVNAIKDKADRLKDPKSCLHRKFKVLQMNLFSQISLKLFSAGGLKQETFRQEQRLWFPPLGAGTDIPTIQFYSSVPNAKETPK
jgi:hypothetical protein